MALSEKLLYVFPCVFPSEHAHTIQVFHSLNELAKLGIRVKFAPQQNKKLPTCQDIERFYGSEIHPNFTISFLPNNELLQSAALRLQITWEGLTGSHIYCRKLGWMRYINLFAKHQNTVEIHKFGRKQVQAAAHAYRVVTISQPLKDKLVEEGIEASKIYVIGSGYNSRFQPVKQTACKDRRLVYFGKLTKGKGVDLIIEALLHLPKTEALIIGGDFQQVNDLNRKRLEQRARKLGVADRVQFTGFLKQQSIPKLLNWGDIGIVPTLPQGTQDISNSPIKLFEYLAMGLPCIATDMPAFKTIANAEKALSFFDAANSLALANAIQPLIDSESLYYETAKAAIEVSKEYSWEGRAKKLAKLITSE